MAPLKPDNFVEALVPCYFGSLIVIADDYA